MLRPRSFHFIDEPIVAKFLERLNRFACTVMLNGRPTKVYLPNSGRLEELLRAGAEVMLERRRETGKTHHDLLLVRTPAYPEQEPIWAGLDSRLPPRLLAWSLAERHIEAFDGWAVKDFEPAVEEGRLDLLLKGSDGPHYIETKSVNLVDQSGYARFPDAPTLRGRRHLEDLIALRREGAEASLVFIIVRQDARSFAPYVERDREFAAGLRRARAAGVGLHAVQYAAGPSFQYRGTVPIELDPAPFPGVWPTTPGDE